MDNKREVRVLHYSTHLEPCGIGIYQEQFVRHSKNYNNVVQEYFPLSPNVAKRYSDDKFKLEVITRLRTMLRDFDVLHIQHEFTFFKSRQLRWLIECAQKAKKQVIVTVHTAPDVQIKELLPGAHPKKLLINNRTKKLNAAMIDQYFRPLSLVDLVITHNEVTKKSLIRYGVNPDSIKVIVMPVPLVEKANDTTDISKNLSKKNNDVVYAAVGFMSAHKGTLQAVKALKFLPDNYKLAIIGGVHPAADNTDYYDKITDYIIDHGLESRVYITGFIDDQAELDGLIRECDICVYPYDSKYYSFVSSASITTAVANHKPIIAYPTTSFLEINKDVPLVTFTKSGNYYELARSIKNLDIKHSSSISQKYASEFSWEKAAKQFTKLYRDVVDT